MRILALLLALLFAPQVALANVAAFPETALRGNREISAIRVGSTARQLADGRRETACFYDSNASAMTDDPINHRDPTGAEIGSAEYNLALLQEYGKWLIHSNTLMWGVAAPLLQALVPDQQRTSVSRLPPVAFYENARALGNASSDAEAGALTAELSRDASSTVMLALGGKALGELAVVGGRALIGLRSGIDAGVSEAFHVLGRQEELALRASFAPRAPGVSRAPGSLWNLGVRERGEAVENALIQGERSLPWNYPVIDDFQDGVATSVKSFDLSKTSVRDSIRSQIWDAADKLSGFTPRNWGAARLRGSTITSRRLVVGLERNGANPDQLRLLDDIAKEVSDTWPNVAIEYHWLE